MAGRFAVQGDNMFRKLGFPALAFLLLGALASATASAAPISYVFEADMFGTLDDQPFASRIRFDLFGDTLVPGTFDNGYRTFLFQDRSTVTVNGFGTTKLLTRHFLIANPNPGCECVAILRTSDTSSIFFLAATGLDLSNPYDFKSALEPVTGDVVGPFGASSPIDTDFGLLILDGVTNTGNASFSATLIPIPAPLVLFGSALGMLAWRIRKPA
jgi:hypothetical protein